VAGVNPSLAGQSSVEPALQPSLLERSRRFAPWVEEAALVSQVDARLLHAVIAVESGYNPRALSPKGAVGIMQLLPATALRYGVVDSWDARQNILGGARYLSSLLRLFHNDTRLALAAYNAGENAVARYNGRIPPYRETEAYVPRVLAVYRHLSKASFR
jgi:soluble lytic murein transglycosylase-like protein